MNTTTLSPSSTRNAVRSKLAISAATRSTGTPRSVTLP